ncbi:MAG: hypothetical protein ACREPT_04080, partial [Rudaea sp.]
LEAVFKSGQVELPKRAGFPMTPSFSSLILVSKRARITRPKVKVGGLDAIIKNDQLKTRIDKDIDEMSPMKLAKMIGQDTLETFARSLATAHKPMHTTGQVDSPCQWNHPHLRSRRPLAAMREANQAETWRAGNRTITATRAARA